MTNRAVLFDFDGVIADTENVHVAAWQRTFGLMGWIESDEVCARAAEIDDRAFVREVFARRKIEGDVEGWVAPQAGADPSDPQRLPQALPRRGHHDRLARASGPVRDRHHDLADQRRDRASSVGASRVFRVHHRQGRRANPQARPRRLSHGHGQARASAHRGRRRGRLSHGPRSRESCRAPDRRRRPSQATRRVGRRIRPTFRTLPTSTAPRLCSGLSWSPTDQVRSVLPLRVASIDRITRSDRMADSR